MKSELANKQLDIDKLSNKINNLIQSLYYINSKEDREKYEEEVSNFCNLYFRCLRSLNIYINKDWLQNKISRNSIKTTLKTFLKRVKNNPSFEIAKIKNRAISWLTGKGIYINRWIPLPKHEVEIKKWKEKFIKNNNNFIMELDECRNKLVKIAQDASKEYLECEQKGNDLTQASRKLKFAFKRLSVIISPDALSILKMYLDKPWILHHKVLRAYEDLYPEILKQFDDNNPQDYKYLRAIWLLGEWKHSDNELTKKLINKYIETLNCKPGNRCLENTLLAQALLQRSRTLCNNLVTNLSEFIDSQLTNIKSNKEIDYYKLRNSYILLNWIEQELVKYYEEFESDFRIKLLFITLKEKKGYNILECPEVVALSEDEPDKDYPVLEPMNMNYSS